MAERWRGQYLLATWLKDMDDQGQVFDLERQWPPAEPADADFSNRLAQATGQLSQRWGEYGGMLSGVVMEGPGQARRGSQQSQPPMYGGAKATNTWQDLNTLVREGETALHELRELMKNPAASLGADVHKRVQELDEPFPNSINVRTAAWAVQTTALTRLYQGDLEGALENLEALSACNRVYVNEPFLVYYMMRIAIVGLSDDVSWDALQAEGWSEPQLARLQQVSPCDELLLQMPKTLQAEQAGRLRDGENLHRAEPLQVAARPMAGEPRCLESGTSPHTTSGFHGRPDLTLSATAGWIVCSVFGGSRRNR